MSNSTANMDPIGSGSTGTGATAASGKKSSPVTFTDKTDHALLRAELLELVIQFNDDKTFRNVFRGIAIRYTGALGCCHVIKDHECDWDVNPKHVTGRVPRRSDFSTQLADRCEETVSRNTIQLDQLEGIDGLQAILAPVPKPGAMPEVFVLVFPDKARLGNQLFVAQILTDALQLWLRDRSVLQSNWKMSSLAALIELVSEIELSSDRRQACQMAADQLARHLSCHTVAVGLKMPKMQLTALSGISDLKQASETSRMYLQALHESVLRGETGVWPSKEDSNDHLLLAHKQLAIKLQVQSVYSFPLKTMKGGVVGACVLTGPADVTGSERFSRFLAAAAPRLATSLEVVTRAEKSFLKRTLSALVWRISHLKTWAIAGLVGLMLLLMLMPIPYRVRCSCSIQPIERRFAVAPFAGLIEQGLAKPGDEVKANQVLARMDGRTIRWELASINAERQQAVKKREVELVGREIAGALLAELESERLSAKESLLNYQRDNLEIRSPIDGVILSGSKNQLESASVETGRVIYEVGPLSPVMLKLEVPAKERAQIDVGMHVSVWIDGQEGRTITGLVSRIYPRSELRNSKNVFVAECEFENSTALLRPGMEGHARIDGARRPLGWCLFHKPWGFIKSRLTFW